MNTKSATKWATYKRAVKGDFGVKDPQKYGLKDKPFTCIFCGHDLFNIANPFLGIGGAFVLVCAKCGHVDFFNQMPEWIKAAKQ
ncbi:MAG: hypothetical protein AB9869_33260 [Verrucomicrobiia bacterium]